MSARVAGQSKDPQSAHVFKNPSLAWMIGFLFVVSFLGLFAVVPLRKVLFACCMLFSVALALENVVQIIVISN